MPYKKQQRVNLFQDERWADIPALKMIYSVSNYGRVYSNRFSRYLSPHVNRSGYWEICICNKHYLVHRLIANAFIGFNMDSNLEVNHIDGNKNNNKIDNLEIVSHADNMRHAWQAGLIRNTMFISQSQRKPYSMPVSRLRFVVLTVLKMSFSEFEKMSGISRKIFSDDSNTFRVATYQKMAETLKINPDWVCKGVGSPLLTPFNTAMP